MNQNRTIMSNCEYSIATLQNLKKAMSYCGDANQQVTWAIGGIICTITSKILHIMHDVIIKPNKSSEPNAKDDLLEIQKRFNEFMDTQIGNLS